jgi:hypothetical protein
MYMHRWLPAGIVCLTLYTFKYVAVIILWRTIRHGFTCTWKQSKFAYLKEGQKMLFYPYIPTYLPTNCYMFFENKTTFNKYKINALQSVHNINDH